MMASSWSSIGTSLIDPISSAKIICANVWFGSISVVPSPHRLTGARRGGRDGTRGLIQNFSSDVYWCEPYGRVVRLSSGDGIYAMACMHPDGGPAVFWGGS